MKANELMIGDYVQVNDEVFKVISISYFDITISDNKGDFYHEHIDNLQPIPITAEILEKNGFGYKEEDGYLSHYYLGHEGYLANPDLHIGTYNKGVYWLNYYDNAIHGIKYVHKLQHALRLCGINKEIKF